MGGWWDVQGNTPITPLIENEKCTHIIVTHLEDGSFWDRRKFPQASILEVRTRGISRKGFTDMLSFEQGSILEWMKQGYEDAKSSIDPVLETLVSFESSKKAHDAAVDAVNTMSQSLDWLKG
jgi:NTE family protein